MKPSQNPTDILNWEAMNLRTEKEDLIIKKRLAEAWLRKYNKN